MNTHSIQSVKSPCPVCREPLTLRLAQGRKSGKTFLMLVCTKNPRHFRGFINDRNFVDGVLSRLEGHTPLVESGDELGNDAAPHSRSKTNLEHPS